MYFLRTELYLRNSSRSGVFFLFFVVINLDIPAKPLSLCSVHSRITCTLFPLFAMTQLHYNDFTYPCSWASTMAFFKPFLLIVRIPAADTFKVIQRFSSSSQNLFVKRFGTKVLFVLLLECETLFPTITLLPVIWQTLDISFCFYDLKSCAKVVKIN